MRQIKKSYGLKVIQSITNGINNLKSNPRKGPSIKNVLGIPSPYLFLHIEHHYIFYRIDENTIYVVDIYNEKEDFMWKLFGIRLRTKDSIDFWGE